MSSGLIDMIHKGHKSFFEQQTAGMKSAIDRAPASSPMSIMHDWENCDGYVKDVETAITAMSLSIVVSIILILFIEKAKLLFYKKAEIKYEKW